MKIHRINWRTATVEASPGPEPQFTLRVKLEGTTTNRWREKFSTLANFRTSLVEPWGQVKTEGDEIVVGDLLPEREFNFIALLFSRLTDAVVQADQRPPLPEENLENLDSEQYQETLRVGADRTVEPGLRARELTDHLRALF